MPETPGVAAPAGDGSHRATRAIQRMVEFAPSTGGLALWVRHIDVDDDAGTAPVAATDGLSVRYAPAFARLPLPEQTGWVAHAVLHVALRHPQRLVQLRQRVGDVDERLFNTCADAIVNTALSHLGWLRLPAGAVQLPALLAGALSLQQDAEAALAQWDLERLYRAIDDRAPPEGRGSAERRRDGPRAARVRALGGEGARDLLPAPGEATAPEADAEAEREWSQRLLRAHAGDGAHSMLRGLLADLPAARTPWELLLRTRLARALAPRRETSWSRPSRSYLANQGRSPTGRRLPWEPGSTAARAVPRLVLVVDVSGSIDAALLQRFGSELQAIQRRLGAALTMVVGDDHVQQVLHHDPQALIGSGRGADREPLAQRLAALRFEAGGTDFTPLLAEAGRHRPDIVVVLTDLDGPALERPPWPVLWAVPRTHAAVVPPFGRLLVLHD